MHINKMYILKRNEQKCTILSIHCTKFPNTSKANEKENEHSFLQCSSQGGQLKTKCPAEISLYLLPFTRAQFHMK